MNIHHLELFYYVARYGGIMEAVRNIPYGIQQPAISGQVAQLEEFLGVSLFQRRPFALTPAGQKLYGFIEPFFSNLGAMAAEMQAGHAGRARIGASAIVLRDHLPELILSARKKYPQLKIILREGYQADLESMLQKEELDLAVTILERKSLQGIQTLPLIELPMALLVPTNSEIRSAEQLWTMNRIEHTLICLPPHETIAKHFQSGLMKRDVDWFPGIEVSSLTLIEAYVRAGFGIGLVVPVPKAPAPQGLRFLPLEGFPPVLLGALWRGKPTPVVQFFLNEMQLRANSLKN